jgi:glycosyl transferase family 87
LNRTVAILIALAGLAFLGFRFQSNFSDAGRGMNDFMNVYTGARLVGTPDQFYSRKYAEDELTVTGWVLPSQLRYLRLPVFAFVARPLTALSYAAAYHVWQALLLAALLGFWWLWPEPGRDALLVAACWSIPLVTSILNGKDVIFLMLFLAGLWRFHESRPWLAGICLALCALKFNLFFLVPVVLIAQRKWRVAAWAVAGVLALLGISTAVSIDRWIPQFIDFALNDVSTKQPYTMSSFVALFAGLPNASTWELAGGVVIAAMVAWLSLRVTFSVALSAALAGGLLTSHHAYLFDLLPLLPMLVVVMRTATTNAVRVLAGLLLSPLPFLISPSVPLLAPAPLLLVLLLVALVMEYATRAPNVVPAASTPVTAPQ